MFEIDIFSIKQDLKHLAGRHDQSTHGRRFGKPSTEGAFHGISEDTTSSSYDQLEKRDSLMKKAYLPWKNSLTPDEYAALRDYTGDGFIDMNARLRNPDETGPYLDKKIEAATAGLNKGSAPFPLQVIRGMSPFPGSDKLWAHLQKSKGKVFSDPAFVSTTIQDYPDFGLQPNSLHLTIHVPKGAKGAYVNSFSKNKDEFEYIIPPKSKFKVLKTWVEPDGTRHAEVGLANR